MWIGMGTGVAEGGWCAVVWACTSAPVMCDHYYQSNGVHACECGCYTREVHTDASRVRRSSPVRREGTTAL